LLDLCWKVESLPEAAALARAAVPGASTSTKKAAG
jgi:hypothetical protein